MSLDGSHSVKQINSTTFVRKTIDSLARVRFDLKNVSKQLFMVVFRLKLKFLRKFGKNGSSDFWDASLGFTLRQQLQRKLHTERTLS